MDLRESRLNAGRPGARHPWELARLEIVDRLLASHGAEPVPRVILDIGCGDAFVAEELSRRHPQTQIVAVDTEFEPEALESLRAKFSDGPIAVFRTLEDAMHAGAPPANVVLLLDVIEHIEDDVGFLAALRDCPLITPATRFLITVPADQRLFCSHDVFLGHYRRYDRELLREHVQRAGYLVEQAGTFFFGPLLLRTLQVWRERGVQDPEAFGLAGWQGGRLTTRCLRALLLWDFACSRILRRLGVGVPGLSQYALCKTSAS